LTHVAFAEPSKNDSTVIEPERIDKRSRRLIPFPIAGTVGSETMDMEG